MSILAIDSSCVSASAAVVGNDGILMAESFQNVGLTHSQTLLPMVRSMLQNAGINPEDITEVAVTNGPGSFTGLRIGTATAMGFAKALDIPCRGVSTLTALAYNCAYGDGTVCAVVDARNNQVYNAVFKVQQGVVKRITEDRVSDAGQLKEELAGKAAVFTGDAAEMFQETPEYQTERYVKAVNLARCVQDGHTRPAHPLCYIRRPQAEQQRLKESQNRGEGKNGNTNT